jgi:hypothetical protein
VRRSRLDEASDAEHVGHALAANDASLRSVFLQLTLIAEPLAAGLAALTQLTALSLSQVTLPAAGCAGAIY